VAVVIAAVAVAGRSSSPPPDVRAITYSKDISHRPPAALLTVGPAAALSIAQARLGSASTIRSASAEEPPAPHGGNGTWLHFVVDAPAADERSLYAQWQTNLVAGTVADALAHSGLGAPVTGTTIEIRLPNGTIVPQQGGMGDIARTQHFSQPADSELRGAIESGLRDSGLSLVSFRVLHVDQPAPVVVVRTDDPPAAARAANALTRSLFLTSESTPRYEGYYFEVQDGDRNPLLIATASFRSGGGSLWSIPSLASDLSLVHG
jgi:hypothetical protein